MLELVKLRGHKSQPRMNKIPAYIVIGLSLLALLAMPYGYYVLLRFVVFGTATYYVYHLYQRNQLTDAWIWPIILVGIIFNPIMPIYQSREIWTIYNIGSAVLFGLFITIKK